MKLEKTTITGIGALLIAAGLVFQDLNNILKPEVLTNIVTGIGLILAGDSKK